MEKEKIVKEQKRIEQLEKKKGKKQSVKRKPWSWLTQEARKVILELVANIEKKGRIRIGEQKKRELLEKLGGKSIKKDPILQPKDFEDSVVVQNPIIQIPGLLGGTPDTVEGYYFNQLLIIHIVGVREARHMTGTATRKRTWTNRSGSWASWSGSSQASRRRVRIGRRLCDEKNTSDVPMEMTSLEIDGDDMEWEGEVKIASTGSDDEEPLVELPGLLAKLNIQPDAPIHDMSRGQA